LRFLDLVASDGAADDADYRGQITAATVADLIAKHAAEHAASHRADARAIGFLGDFAHRLDGAAVVADRRHRIVSWRGGADLRRRAIDLDVGFPLAADDTHGLGRGRLGGSNRRGSVIDVDRDRWRRGYGRRDGRRLGGRGLQLGRGFGRLLAEGQDACEHADAGERECRDGNCCDQQGRVKRGAGVFHGVLRESVVVWHGL